MLKTIARGLAEQAHVWLEELPDVTYPVLEVLERSIEIRESVVGTARRAAIEVVRMAGHPSSYGLLGASFTPNCTNRLLIQVASSTAEQKLLAWALAGRCDEVYAGFPAEYAYSVLEAVAGTGSIHDLGPGTLRFDHAAHGVVGSSPWLFGELGLVVVDLLAHSIGLCTDDELTEIIQIPHGSRASL